MSGAAINAPNNSTTLSTRKTKNSAKAAESAAEMAKSPDNERVDKTPTELDIAFSKEGVSYRKSMANMQETLKSNSYLKEAFSENISVDEKFSLLITELYRLKKANDAMEIKYNALLQRFEAHEDTIRQNNVSQDDAFQDLTDKISANENGIVDLHAEKQELATQIADITQKLEVSGRDINLLKGFSDRFEKQFDVLKAKTVAITARSMDRNLIFSGIPESRKENCKNSIVEFLAKQMGIHIDPQEIKFAYRQGRFSQGKNRPIIVKVARNLKERILSKKTKLRDIQKSTGESFYINVQMPDAMVAEKKAIQYEVKRIQKFNEIQNNEQDKLQYYIKSNQLFIEDQLHEQEIFPPRPTELFVTPKEQEILDNIPIGMSQPKTKGGSVFIGLAMPVQTLRDVNRAYRKARQMYPSYDHVMMAYKLKDISGYQDDGEHSAGIKLHALLCEKRKTRMALFVARSYGGAHLGPMRFSYILEVAAQAIDHLLDIADKLPQPEEVASISQQRQADPPEQLESPTNFPDTPRPEESWPSADDPQWNALKSLNHSRSHEDPFETPDEDQQTSDDPLGSSDEEEAQDSQNTTIIKKTL